MLFLTALVIGLAAANPLGSLDPRQNRVQIKSIRAIGTGCPTPADTVIDVDDAGNTFNIAFNQLVASTGTGSSPMDSNRNCNIVINVQFPKGKQFSIVATTFRGSARIPEGVTGVCQAEYNFAGVPSPTITFRKNIPGRFQDNYELTTRVSERSWSQCGLSNAILNLNAEVSINPFDTRRLAAMQVSRGDGKFHVKLSCNWRDC